MATNIYPGWRPTVPRKRPFSTLETAIHAMREWYTHARECGECVAADARSIRPCARGSALLHAAEDADWTAWDVVMAAHVTRDEWHPGMGR